MLRATWGLLVSGLLLALLGGCWWRYRAGRRVAPLLPAGQNQLRSTIAAHLHDELGALLLRIALQAERLRSHAPTPATEQLLTDTQTACSALRDVAWGLDAEADTLGALQDRMLDQLDQLALTNALTIRFVPEALDAALVLPARLRQEVYLLFREATTNVLRHARSATLLVVHLYRREGNLLLEVLDDGASPAAGPGPSRSGMGLRGMQRRAQALGGQLEAGPRPDGPGFRVWLSAPLGLA